MSSNLRSILKKQQQELTLKKYLGESYETTSEGMKETLLDAADESIEKEVIIY